MYLYNLSLRTLSITAPSLGYCQREHELSGMSLGVTLVVKPLSQSGHLKGRSLVWDLMWISSPDAHPNTCNRSCL